MPELPDNDPRFRDFATRLSRMVQMFVGRPLDHHTMRQINTMIDHQRIDFKRTYGYDIPELVAIVLPTSRHVHFFRADLETAQIQIDVMNMLRLLGLQGRQVDKLELASAIKMAWPDYDPGIETFAADGQAKRALIN